MGGYVDAELVRTIARRLDRILDVTPEQLHDLERGKSVLQALDAIHADLERLAAGRRPGP